MRAQNVPYFQTVCVFVGLGEMGTIWVDSDGCLFLFRFVFTLNSLQSGFLGGRKFKIKKERKKT